MKFFKTLREKREHRRENKARYDTGDDYTVISRTSGYGDRYGSSSSGEDGPTVDEVLLAISLINSDD